ncbi:MAG TPA: ParB/RepB/Spo0J family partition protein [Candidatus Kapabacteria bacterium]|nr:ParB/RepB/Spo0J family partition protein [Candidatus Kapabacteria bacterium]
MAKMKVVLGKGLNALIPTESPAEAKRVEPVVERPVVQEPAQPPELAASGELPIDLIRRNPFQPREEFDEQALQELADSIREHGIIQPITVRRVDDGYELIAGERRLRAARAAGLEVIPAFIRDVVDDAEILELALIENVQREHLNPMEIAQGYQRLIDECDLTQEEVAQKVSKDRTTVTNFLRLLKLPAEIQSSLRKNELTTGHARTLVNLPGRELQVEVWKKIVSDGLSVRRTEELARQLMKDTGTAKKTPAATAVKLASPSKEVYGIFTNIESRLRTILATQVKIKASADGKGHIEIEFYTDEDLDRIIEIIESTQQS